MVTLEQAAEAIHAESAANSGYVEVCRNPHEIILGGDRQGLLWLASQCIQLAIHGQPGSHLHLDEINTEVCEQSLVIRHWQREKSN